MESAHSVSVRFPDRPPTPALSGESRISAGGPNTPGSFAPCRQPDVQQGRSHSTGGNVSDALTRSTPARALLPHTNPGGTYSVPGLHRSGDLRVLSASLTSPPGIVRRAVVESPSMGQSQARPHVCDECGQAFMRSHHLEVRKSVPRCE